MQSEKSKLNHLLSFSCYTVVTHLGRERTWGVFVFRVRGGEGGRSVCFCQSKCLVEVSFSREAVDLPPPSSSFFEVTCFTSLTKSGVFFLGWGGTPAQRLTQPCSSSALCASVCVCTHLLCVCTLPDFLKIYLLEKFEKKKKKIRARWQLTVLRKLWKTMRNMKCIVMVIFSYIL